MEQPHKEAQKTQNAFVNLVLFALALFPPRACPVFPGWTGSDRHKPGAQSLFPVFVIAPVDVLSVRKLDPVALGRP